ncbi:hydrogenase maturation nickel metallochaperone HypA [Moorella sp. E306M]|uniref:hydrogenase maturation nickel metallochaperone HypA n=1 Tax=Moorella sp. E306M TaxID=2572683 RepID=UPI0010FFB0D6|nr:hydrogenase maturation nickel metallochaperone HypA [Moorella sp. E306M]GEA18651.1 putative hydrogenase nickel incorporation protein HypA [Moorella sp. E306M]
MHELALTAELLKLLERSAREKGIKRIRKVKLVIGAMTSVLPSALEFSFYALKEGPLFEGAQLEIEERPGRGHCQDCQAEVVLDNWCIMCPSCGSRRVAIDQGRELYIDFYEGE